MDPHIFITTRASLRYAGNRACPRHALLHRDFFSCSLAERQARSRLRDELARFSVITQPPATPFGQSKRTFTGKVSGQQDDLAVATMIAVEAGVTFFQSDKYRDFAYQR